MYSANYKWVLIGSKTIEANLEPIRFELLTGQRQRNRMAAGVGRFGDSKEYLIHAKFCRINENEKYINESTSNWTFGQQKHLHKTTESLQPRISSRDSS